MSKSLSDQLYQKLTNEEDARACKNIDEQACREVPGNFLTILLSQFFTNLGDALSNPKIVLPMIMELISAPMYLIGFLVPIRESGSLIPQLVIASYVRRLQKRKWAWVLGSLVQAISVLAMGAIAFTLTGAIAGWSIIGLLIIFSLARGLCSVASKDVTGKTIPKSRRGQLSGWSASFAGLITISIGLVYLYYGTDIDRQWIYALLICSGLTWIIAAASYSRVVEFEGETGGGGNAITTAIKRLALLRTDKPFALFVLARALMLCSALTAPYYVLLASQRTEADSSAALLGGFVTASGLAALLGGPFWGRFADYSSRKVMIWSALITALLGVLVFAIGEADSPMLEWFWFVPLLYFCLTLAHLGVRIGRKTYVIDLAGGNKRTDYVSVSNSVIGIVLLLLGFSGALTQIFAVHQTILLLSLLGIAGAIAGYFLPET